MNNRHIIILTLVLQLVALLLGSCSDRLGIDSDAGGNNRVRFTPVISEMNDLTPTADTRAMAAKHVVRLSHTEGIPQLYLHIEPVLEMGGSRLQGDGTRAIYTTNNTISKLTYTICKENDAPGKPFVVKGLTTNTNNWITDTEWPHGSGQKFKVYSLSPFDEIAQDISVTNQDKINYDTPPVFEYTMPDIDKQLDAIYAESDPCDPEASHAITMNYRHIFSGLALAEYSMISGLKLKKVEIKGLYAKGTCKLSKSDITCTVDKTVTKDFTLIKDYTTVGQNSALITPTDRDELMVIPQKAPDDAKVTVTIGLPNGTEKTLTASIAGMEFKRGVVHWLLISTSALNWKYTLSVTQNEINTPYKGGTTNITVNSFRTSANNDEKDHLQNAEPFKVEYSTDDGNTWTDTKPAWLTSVPTFVSGSLSSETKVGTSAQTVTTQPHSANLQNKPAVNDYDLSLYDVNGKEIIGGSSTANCYVIHGPGTYRLPCVYGNTLKLGQYNGYAVDYLNESGQGEAFVDYAGKPISKNNYKFSPSSAAVLWQSTSGAVSNASVTTENGMSYVTFTVNKDGLQQGNAVIAARNASGTVMWSWHLWITDATLQSTATDFLTQNLGWVSASDSYSHYPARSVKLRISQTNPLSDAGSVVITVNQTEADVDSDPNNGSCLYYQWGRKDPFRGSDITRNNCTLVTDENEAPLNLSIQTPSKPILYYYYDDNYWTSSDEYGWTSDHYNVLWNARYSTQKVNTPVEKSVYDPSPYGFRAPRGPMTYKELFASLPNMGYYSLDSWYGYSITVSNSPKTKYYWTSRASNNANASSWYGYIVSTNGYSEKAFCSSLLPLRPYMDNDSGKPLQTSN